MYFNGIEEKLRELLVCNTFYKMLVAYLQVFNWQVEGLCGAFTTARSNHIGLASTVVTIGTCRSSIITASRGGRGDLARVPGYGWVTNVARRTGLTATALVAGIEFNYVKTVKSVQFNIMNTLPNFLFWKQMSLNIFTAEYGIFLGFILELYTKMAIHGNCNGSTVPPPVSERYLQLTGN